MKYLKEFNEYKPDIDSVEKWVSFLDDKYKIQNIDDSRFIMIDDKPYHLKGFLFNKGKLTDRIFWDIKYESEENGSKIHEPSLRKAIKNWIDKHNMLKESLDSFDLQFAMAKIKEKSGPQRSRFFIPGNRC